MNISKINNIDAIESFLEGNQAIAFAILGDKHERYKLVQSILIRLRYITLSKPHKGMVIRFLIKITGYSRQQMTRLISKYMQTGTVHWHPARKNGFHKKYQRADTLLLAQTDEIHNTPCGHAIKKICERALHVFGDARYERMADISVSQIYTIRKTKTYREKRQVFTKTQSKKSAIGTRRKPQPNNKPGYIRVDTVHQGDLNKTKGVYHINAVDEETQFEAVCTVEKISEQFLLPVLEEMIASFPFRILGFHSDNGSEYINRRVAELLEKLLIEFTKSRSRHSNDNALAESKNGSVVRKIFGYGHIPQKWASKMNEFNSRFLNPHLNYHRPCFFPVIKTDAKGKQKKHYPYERMMTPYDKLKVIPNAETYLKPEVTFKDLDEFSMLMSDNESARILNNERTKLFNLIFERCAART